MFGWFFKKKEVPQETELRRNLREATQKLHDKRVNDYVEDLLKRCRDASEKGLFSIITPDSPNHSEFFDWAVEGHSILKKKGLDVKYKEGQFKSPVTISWK